MARRPKLKLRDRVHFPGNPQDTGTVIEFGYVMRPLRPWTKSVYERRALIEWDRPQSGSTGKDIDEATERGRLLHFWEKEEKMFVVRLPS